MALQKQTIAIPLVGGQDTKSDPKQVELGKFLEIKNVSYQSTLRAKKRNGYERKGDNTTLTNTITADSYLEELVTSDGKKIYTLSESEDEFREKGSKVAIQVASEDVVTNAYDQSSIDRAVGSTYSTIAWVDSSGGVRYSVTDNETGSRIVDNVLLNATAFSPRVVKFGTRTVIFYSTGSDLIYRSIADATPDTISGESTITNGTSVFDAKVVSTRLFVAYKTGSDIGFRYFDTSLVLSAETLVTIGDVGSYISLFGDSSNNVWCTYQVFDTLPNFGISYLIRDFNLGAVLAPTVIETSTTIIDFEFPVGVYDGSNGQIFYSVVDEDFKRDTILGDPPEYVYFQVKKAQCTVGGVVTGPSVVIKSVGVASRPVIVSGTIYLFVSHGSELQSTFFLVSSDGKTHMKLAYGLGGGRPAGNKVPDVELLSGVYSYPYQKRRLVGSTEGEVADVNGVSVASFQFDKLIPSEEMAQNLHLGGGILSMYDGQSVAEHGFNLFPEGVDLQWIPSQGALYDGTYQYAVTYEWTDSQGQIHRSAPSVPESIKTDSEEFTDVAVNINSGSPNLDLASGNEKLPLFQRGMAVTTTNLPAGSRISDVVFTPFRIIANANATATSGPQTATVNPTMPLEATFGFASTTLEVADFVDLPMTGRANSAGTQVEMADASILSVNDTLYYDNVAHTVTAISGNTITISPAVVAPLNGWLTFYAQRVTSGITVALNNNITGLPTWFVDQVKVGSRIFAAAFPDPTYVTAILTPNSIQCDQSATISSPSATIAVGFSPASILKEGQIISGSGIQPNTKITKVTTIVPFSDAPSVEIEVDLPTTAAGTLSDILIETFTGTVLTIPTLRITDKPDNNPVTIVVYRTLVDQSVFYRVTSFDVPTINDKTVDTVTFFDNKSDQEIQGNSVLYTTGGVLENIAAPAAYSMGSFKNRVLLVPAEDRGSVWISQQVVAGAPVEFSDFLTVRVPETGGPVEAAAQLDDKLVIFKQTAIFATAGEGPNASGLQNDFGYPQIISSDVGCTEFRSIVTTPMGLMFKSAKGIYLLDRAMNVSYIGKDVESSNAIAVTSATLVKNQNHVRFTLDNGTVLVFEYLTGQWLTYTGIDAQDACIWDGQYTVGLSNGQVWKETPGTYTDNTALVPISFKTSWMSLADVQGFQRIYRILILGEYKSPHTLTINVRRDFNDTIVQTTTIPVLTDPGTYQFQVHITIQKTEAIQFEIIETQAGPTYGEGFSLSNVAVELGVKGGLNRMKAAAQYG